MYPKKPGLGETEELGADASVDQSLQPNETEASSTATEPQATDVSEPVAETTTETPASDVTEAETAEAPVSESVESAEAEAPTGEVAEPAEESAPAGGSTPGLKRGDLIEGTILSTSPTLITVDVGAAKEGIVPGHELERMNRRTLEFVESRREDSCLCGQSP